MRPNETLSDALRFAGDSPRPQPAVACRSSASCRRRREPRWTRSDGDGNSFRRIPDRQRPVDPCHGGRRHPRLHGGEPSAQPHLRAWRRLVAGQSGHCARNACVRRASHRWRREARCLSRSDPHHPNAARLVARAAAVRRSATPLARSSTTFRSRKTTRSESSRRRSFVPTRYVAINGAVRKSGQFPYREGMTIRDLVLLAGGLDQSAYLNEAEVARLPAEPGWRGNGHHLPSSARLELHLRARARRKIPRPARSAGAFRSKSRSDCHPL